MPTTLSLNQQRKELVMKALECYARMTFATASGRRDRSESDAMRTEAEAANALNRQIENGQIAIVPIS